MFIIKRMPPRNQIILVFASIIFPLYSWTTYLVLDYLPSWLKSMKIWEIFSINAYAYVWTLIESLIILLFVITVALLIPVKWLRENFVSKGSVLVWIVYIFAFIVQINEYEIKNELVAGLILIACIIFSFILISKYHKIDEIIHSIADRLVVFLYVYIPISVVGVMIVLYNNIRSTP